MPISDDPSGLTVQEMYDLTEERYREFVRDEGVFWVDHHNNLRHSSGAVMATTREQFDILLDELGKLREKMMPGV